MIRVLVDQSNAMTLAVSGVASDGVGCDVCVDRDCDAITVASGVDVQIGGFRQNRKAGIDQCNISRKSETRNTICEYGVQTIGQKVSPILDIGVTVQQVVSGFD